MSTGIGTRRDELLNRIWSVRSMVKHLEKRLNNTADELKRRALVTHIEELKAFQQKAQAELDTL